jgi:hypothetical protein
MVTQGKGECIKHLTRPYRPRRASQPTQALATTHRRALALVRTLALAATPLAMAWQKS